MVLDINFKIMGALLNYIQYSCKRLMMLKFIKIGK